ncbi:MAG: hypothetical protein F6K41_26730 [Symploca sp. SIO3E6]|nr:hypothetical protein [Caldora sp. SIO3E6]
MSEKKGGERRSGGAEERRKKRELIIFGYNAQEIPPKISFTRDKEDKEDKGDGENFYSTVLAVSLHYLFYL